KTPEGREITFDFKEIREYWANFYREHNLPELAAALPETINLTLEQITRIQKLAEQGYNHFILLPSPELQDQYLAQIKQETLDTPLEGLAESQQYTETHLSDTVQPNFPDKIKTLNREENTPYLVFLKDLPEAEEETRNASAQELRIILESPSPDKARKKLKELEEELKKTNPRAEVKEFSDEFLERMTGKDLKGQTLPEYLIFQRDYTKRHKEEDRPHPEHQYYTWLLDSELSEDASEPGRVLGADWLPDDRRVRVDSYDSSHQYSYRGARSSAILSLTF
ncbi:MAG: hypothetical protein AB1465_06150, partial [Patescibacteria group bacterium]